jgi:hypothetical protein
MRKTILCALVLLALLPALAVAQSNAPSYSLQYSPTSSATCSLFREASDQYLSVLFWGELVDPVFMFKLGLLDGNIGAPSMTEYEAYEVGFGGKFGAYHLGGYYAFDGRIVGSANGSQSIYQLNDETLIMSNDGLSIVGKTNTTTERIQYQMVSLNNPKAIFGMKLGAMQIGVKDSLRIYDQSYYGTYAADTGNLSSSTVATVSDRVAATAGDSYNVWYTDSTQYAKGKKSNLVIDNQLEGGVAMPLGAMKLRGLFRLGVNINDAGTNSYADERRTINTTDAFPNYTPAAGMALPGNTVAAINNLQYWRLRFWDDVNNPLEIAPALVGQVEYPFSFVQNPAVAVGGLEYSGQFDIRAVSMNTLGATPASFTAGYGSTNSYTTRTVTHDANTGFYGVTTVEDKAYTANLGSTASANPDSYYTAQNEIALPVGMTMEPSKLVRFGFNMRPSFKLSSYSYKYARETTTTTTLDDGDGIAAATDPDDTITVAYTQDAPYTHSMDNTKVVIGTKTGVQIYLKPNVFRLNLGASSTTTLLDRSVFTQKYTDFARTRTTVTAYRNDGVNPAAVTSVVTAVTETLPVTTADTEKRIYDNPSITWVSYQAGMTYFLNPNVSLDLIVTNPAAFNLGNFTDMSNDDYTGGFLDLQNYSIQMTIKLPPQASKGE